MLLLLFSVLASCGAQGDCIKWADRPNCEPVGTTTTIRSNPNGDQSCVETRFFDEIGEASGYEVGCS